MFDVSSSRRLNIGRWVFVLTFFASAPPPSGYLLHPIHDQDPIVGPAVNDYFDHWI